MFGLSHCAQDRHVLILVAFGHNLVAPSVFQIFAYYLLHIYIEFLHLCNRDMNEFCFPLSLSSSFNDSFTEFIFNLEQS